MKHKNCYSPELTLGGGESGAELNLAAIREWLDRTRALGLSRAVPEFVVKLDRMSRTAMNVVDRLDALRELKRPLLKLVAAMPKPVTRLVPGATSPAPLLEQRLYCLMFKNLRQALEDLNVSHRAFSAEADKRRRWAVRNLFRFLARQIEFGLTWQRPVPTDTWQSLHDLYTYLTARGIARPGAVARRYRRLDDFEPGIEYRRLLLLGLLGGLLHGRQVPGGLIEGAAGWAEESRLVEQDAYVGAFGVLAVETSRDAPPRYVEGALAGGFRGWVLIPAPGFLDAVGASDRKTAAFDPSASIRAGFRAV
jgi:hypothetical protein